MRYIIAVLFVCCSVSSTADENNLSDILQKSGEKKAFKQTKSEQKKHTLKKTKKFIFKESYDSNGIGLNAEEFEKNKQKSKSFEYEDSSRFKFQFNSGSSEGNFAGSPSMGSGGTGAPGGGRGGR